MNEKKRMKMTTIMFFIKILFSVSLNCKCHANIHTWPLDGHIWPLEGHIHFAGCGLRVRCIARRNPGNEKIAALFVGSGYAFSEAVLLFQYVTSEVGSEVTCFRKILRPQP